MPYTCQSLNQSLYLPITPYTCQLRLTIVNHAFHLPIVPYTSQSYNYAFQFSSIPYPCQLCHTFINYSTYIFHSRHTMVNHVIYLEIIPIRPHIFNHASFCLFKHAIAHLCQLCYTLINIMALHVSITPYIVYHAIKLTISPCIRQSCLTLVNHYQSITPCICLSCYILVI